MFMCKISFVNQLLSFLTVLSLTVKASRKYDINDEAHKLYKTDLKHVLQNFRRSPEYQKILEDKKNGMHGFVEDAYSQILHGYTGKLTKRIQEVFEIDKYAKLITKATTKASDIMRRNEEEPEKNPGIAKLDKYNKFYAKLTLKEKNHMKDLGFTYAGHVIHSLIKAMGADDVEIKSTRQPYSDDDEKKKRTESTTTEHVQVHEVTSPKEKEISGELIEETSTPTPQYYRQRRD